MNTWKEGEYRGREREALCEWLGKFKWQIFATLTYRLPRGERTFLKPFKEFLAFLAKDRGYVWAFVAGEWFKNNSPSMSNPALHIHALIGYAEPCLVERFWSYWFYKYGEAKLKVYDEKKGAAYYVTKYILKDEKLYGQWDLLEAKDWRAMK